MYLIVSLTSGILAAFSPCNIVLLPLLMHRFLQEKNRIKSYLFFVVGFITSYIVFAFALQALFQSSFKNGFQLGFGLLIIVLGILSLAEKINPLNLPFFKNYFINGIIYALLLSSNPCTLPFLSSVMVISSQLKATLNLLVFSLGLISPALIFTVFGNAFIDKVVKKGQLFHQINRLINGLLIVAGFYLIFEVSEFYLIDVYVSLVMLFVIFLILLRVFLILRQGKDLLQIKNILLISALLLLVFLSGNYCHHHFKKSDQATPVMSCTASHKQECEFCQRCMYIFSTALILGSLGIYLKKKSCQQYELSESNQDSTNNNTK